MGIFIIEVEDTHGDTYPPVGVHADTPKEAIDAYEATWYPGVFTDPSFGIGEIKIKYVGSVSLKDNCCGSVD
jgi:hypothetical protein